MTTLTVPGAPTIDRRPLSDHGLPKPPRLSSSSSSHRFQGRNISIQEEPFGLSSPRTPGLMSPPMSARSIGTFIDSEPSTPAYSPRMDYDWDKSNTLLVRPMSSSSEPSSPTEPVWDMIKPMEITQQVAAPLKISHKESCAITRDVPPPPPGPGPASPLRKRVRLPPQKRTVVPVEVYRPPPREDDRSYTDNTTVANSPSEQPSTNSTAPLGKFASKVKMMLRRKSTTDKKKDRKKEKDYYDPIEPVHWTEM